MTEEDYRKKFDNLRPHIMKALLDVLVEYQHNRAEVVCEDLPRMADFAKFGIAVEQPLGYPARQFMEAYGRNMKAAKRIPLETSVIAPYLEKIVDKQKKWEGTARTRPTVTSSHRQQIIRRRRECAGPLKTTNG